MEENTDAEFICTVFDLIFRCADLAQDGGEYYC
jgi:hypothetical protein